MENKQFDYIIIGAGPAGLSSAQYAARGGLKVAVLEASSSGGQVMQISELENYPGLYPATDGTSFTENMINQAKAFGAEIYTETVTSIDKRGNLFTVKTKNNSYSAPTLLIATGAIHKTLDIPGEKELSGLGVSYCAICDGPFFPNKKIFVIGGGDSACSEAIYLSGISKDITIIHRRDSFRAQKAVVDKMLSLGIKTKLNSNVTEIKGKQKVESIVIKNTITGTTEEIAADAVFIFTGMSPQTDLVEMLEKDEAGYIKTNENMETAVPGLYAAGDIRSKSLRQIVTAVSDGAIAAHCAQKYIQENC